jgi:hypothetical protein
MPVDGRIRDGDLADVRFALKAPIGGHVGKVSVCQIESGGLLCRRRLGACQSITDHRITPAAIAPVTAEKNASGMSKRSAIGIYSSM